MLFKFKILKTYDYSINKGILPAFWLKVFIPNHFMNLIFQHFLSQASLPQQLQHFYNNCSYSGMDPNRDQLKTLEECIILYRKAHNFLEEEFTNEEKHCNRLLWLLKNSKHFFLTWLKRKAMEDVCFHLLITVFHPVTNALLRINAVYLKIPNSKNI